MLEKKEEKQKVLCGKRQQKAMRNEGSECGGRVIKIDSEVRKEKRRWKHVERKWTRKQRKGKDRRK